jgi:hypothetical protein
MVMKVVKKSPMAGPAIGDEGWLSCFEKSQWDN